MASHNSWTRRVVATLVSFALATQPFPVSALALEPDDSSPNEATGVVWEEPFGQQGAPVSMGEDGVGGLEEEASSQADGIALVPQEADEQRTADASDMEEQQKEAQSPEQQESEVPVQTQSEPQETGLNWSFRRMSPTCRRPRIRRKSSLKKASLYGRFS